MIRLFISLYDEPDPVRREEIRSTLKTNMELGVFGEVCALVEGNYFRDAANRNYLTADRPTFHTLFELANKISQPQDVVVVGNNDIIFDSSILLVNTHLASRDCYALTRHESNGRLPDQTDSQDAWRVNWLFSG